MQHSVMISTQVSEHRCDHAQNEDRDDKGSATAHMDGYEDILFVLCTNLVSPFDTILDIFPTITP